MSATAGGGIGNEGGGASDVPESAYASSAAGAAAADSSEWQLSKDIATSPCWSASPGQTSGGTGGVSGAASSGRRSRSSSAANGDGGTSSVKDGEEAQLPGSKHDGTSSGSSTSDAEIDSSGGVGSAAGGVAQSSSPRLTLNRKGSSSGTKAPWLPDSLTTACMNCKKPFTWLARRHHCRECGMVVCHACSQHKHVATGYDRSVRICDLCHVHVSSPPTPSSPSSASSSLSSSPVVAASATTGAASEADANLKPTAGKSRADVAQRLSQSRTLNPQLLSSQSSGATAAATPSSSASASSVADSDGVVDGASAALSHPSSERAVRSHARAGLASGTAMTMSFPLSQSTDALASGLSAGWPALLHVSCTDLFNLMSGFGSLLMVDIRPSAAYKQLHVPRSLSVPFNDIMPPFTSSPSSSTSALASAASSSSVRLSSLAELEAGMPLADRRIFKLRQRQHVVIIHEDELAPFLESHAARSGPADEPAAQHAASGAQVETQSNDVLLRNTVLSADDKQLPSSLYFAKLLMKERKLSSIAVLHGGFPLFRDRYQFLCCAYSAAEMGNGRHNHRPAFPWYPNEIVDNFLFLGNHIDAKNAVHLKHLGVSHVLNVSSEVNNEHPNDFEYLRLTLDDEEDTDIAAHFNQAFLFLDAARQAGGRVLVHCHQGISRSATIVLAYVMKTQAVPLYAAYGIVKKHRKLIQPNQGFWRQLGLYEWQLYGSSTLDQCTASLALDKQGQLIQRGNAPGARVVPLDAAASTPSGDVDASATSAAVSTHPVS